MWQNDVTILIPTSLLTSHPSIAVIKDAVDSLNIKMGCANVKKIIIADPPLQQSDVFDEYLSKLPYEHIVRLDRKKGLPGAIRTGIAMTKTPIVFVFQHDFAVKKAVNLEPLIEILLADNDVNYIRFNKRRNHVKRVDKWLESRIVNGIEMLATLYGWSDNPHLATLKAYEDIYLPLAYQESSSSHGLELPISKQIKRDMWKYGNHETHKKYGTYLYGPLNHPHIVSPKRTR